MFITPTIAAAHLRLVGNDVGADITLKAEAAEQAAISYLDRAVYEDQAQLDAAIALVPAALAAAKAAYAAADDAATLIADTDLCLIEKTYAFDTYLKAKFAAARIRRGLVINSAIQSAMLLILGDLWENREDTAVGVSVTPVPNGARCLLDAYRHYGA
ncbi:head-tail connector protein [Polaromonas sp. CG_23.6]|uniref:head-tail connector protein n=1 Tax=Polaromonas sp. CG_23.6 TaxID=2760709 RepID=UPI00247446D9|nr:head-tail connector protein [Polaromonas sp. CG_23.6]MDH6185486.1 multidrug efflux pump subunit AcrA (membrane-fusion protein) [Polaromonas sp. CG_23.6]